jgi:hypothetical protein
VTDDDVRAEAGTIRSRNGVETLEEEESGKVSATETVVDPAAFFKSGPRSSL